MENVITLPVSPLQETETEVYLSNQMIEILADVIKGMNNKDLAEKYHITRHGIAYRVNSICHAFGMSGRAELLCLATSKGLHFKSRTGKKRVYFLDLILKTREY
jgi:DNA-binding NarL/FixJ family response regulator